MLKVVSCVDQEFYSYLLSKQQQRKNIVFPMVDEIKSILCQSLFDDQQDFVIPNAVFLKSNKSDDIALVQNLIQDKQNFLCLLVSDKPILIPNVECKHYPKFNSLMTIGDFVRQLQKEYNVIFKNDSCFQSFINKVEPNPFLIENLFKKSQLLFPNQSIGEEQIKEILVGVDKTIFYSLFEYFIQKKYDQAIILYEKIISNDPLSAAKIINYFTIEATKLRLLLLARKTHQPLSLVFPKEKPWQIQKYINYLENMSEKEIAGIIQNLYLADEYLKKGKVEQKVLIKTIILNGKDNL